MATYELMMKVKEILEANGYETSSVKLANRKDYEVQARATKDGKTVRTRNETYGVEQVNGYEILFEVVYRHNGTNEDVSVDIGIYEWNNNSGRRIAKERVNNKMGNKAITNRLNKIMEQFETL